ncbi:MBL fold metallo-hydrolase [Noviherbaspirillum sp. UKPF54]|uniref:MBL fold metallo-hydrolase n=1 Tax=Noviherbaspirillum sp. UKPF54 TaxID=2601898 RepID=UPI0011B15BFA|nr:MBL fold metallo-hydrolase [Noviherbaspirillum sp. UKPF54]QDZ30015.1 MBL fold metallo-hydrolase [Noviherbaspirillum sp. UKPF54]
MKLPASMHVFQRGWLSSNNILFVGSEETALVDSGYVTHAAQTVALVSHALQGRALNRLINTHLHSDHCGGNAALHSAFGCRTSIPAAEADKVRAWNEDALTYAATGQACARFGFDDTLAPGDVLTLGDMTWQALGAPGHDPHSLIFYCPDERILISADALWESGFGVVFPELEGEPGFAEVRATLELIASLDVKLVIPGHGAPFAGVDKALETAFSRIDYFMADPRRNAQNALKVLLKFLLLDRQRMTLDEVRGLFARMRLSVEANRRYFNLSEAELAQWAVDQLVRAGAAQLADGVLVNRD